MELLEILTFPDPRLNQVAVPISAIDHNIKKIADQMFATMYHARGVGLAATQVNIQQRIIVVDIASDLEPVCLINPVITQHTGKISWQEGCLSFPGIYTAVKRFAQVVVEYQDLNNQTKHITAEGLLSVCLQHEIDHLDGITFYNRISPLKQTMLQKKLKRLEVK